jgi:arylsulfatase A-like enzyme
MQGRDFSPLYLAAERPAWRTEFFYEHAVVKAKDVIPASEALVRKDWKYMRWPDFDYEQLFDLLADPGEETDLAREPAQAAKLAELRGRFAELKAAAK